MHLQSCIATAAAALAMLPCVIAAGPSGVKAESSVRNPKYGDHCELTACQATWTGGSKSEPCPPKNINVDARKVIQQHEFESESDTWWKRDI
ncbi:hypothetical protein MGG_17667 [Pyricularia oryzae 70-15]|uniref:Uncharacterized protein n=1 Tax=Pyricularia oryzae (strain 70-15 / ATCC MYA-4617 / FGSC 8958) TaxID=242507 RepID=G4NFC6_PYRO7|nr:uncharacterized protein MGG_17667 [Pyricularia oryzae 70-15]EHA47220.1 hypothetical protein MGG_17667 [Pyricularia oryzae 70-15]